MSKPERTYAELIDSLKNQLKDLKESNQKLNQEKKALESENDSLSNIIKEKRKQIIQINKMTFTNEPKKDKETQRNNIKAKLTPKEDLIKRKFLSIQKNVYLHQQERFRENIDYLYNNQKEMKVSYIIIKKLDIKEAFLNENKIPESTK